MSSALSRAERVTAGRFAALVAVFGDYYEIGKPRIMYLLLVTTAAAMIMAARGIPSLSLLVWTLAGGALASLCAGTLNCVYDVDIDRVMRRTATRPLPAGRMTVFAATMHAIVLGVVSFCIFYFRVNHLSAWLSLAGNIYYVAIYTMWLKRRTPLNIVIGGAAGAIPPLVGWAAVTGTIGWPAVALFAVIFLWTPPHFWSLALMTEIDYDKAHVPMLPNVAGEARTRREILVYSVVLVIATLALAPLRVMGAPFAAAAAALGALFLMHAWNVEQRPGNTAPRALFKYSLVYLALICFAMVADRIIA